MLHARYGEMLDDADLQVLVEIHHRITARLTTTPTSIRERPAIRGSASSRWRISISGGRNSSSHGSTRSASGSSRPVAPPLTARGPSSSSRWSCVEQPAGARSLRSSRRRGSDVRTRASQRSRRRHRCSPPSSFHRHACHRRACRAQPCWASAPGCSASRSIVASGSGSDRRPSTRSQATPRRADRRRRATRVQCLAVDPRLDLEARRVVRAEVVDPRARHRRAELEGQPSWSCRRRSRRRARWGPVSRSSRSACFAALRYSIRRPPIRGARCCARARSGTAPRRRRSTPRRSRRPTSRRPGSTRPSTQPARRPTVPPPEVAAARWPFLSRATAPMPPPSIGALAAGSQHRAELRHAHAV